MSREHELDELGSRVSDGERIDWEQMASAATSDEDRRVLRNMRLLEDIAMAHRTLHGTGSTLQVGGTLSGSADDETSRAQAPIAPGAGWGGLEIRRRVGEGGFGEVYLAWDPQLEREVALKLLKREPSARGSVASAVIREGRLLARIRHPNVVTVHGADTHDGRVGLWMEYVSGRSLEALLREQGKFGAREAGLIGIDLCRALVAVHRAGLVHRDVKAKNVMREHGGRIILMDFGAGRSVAEIEKGTAKVSGTPLYIAPELYLGQPATARSDLYSLGVLLFHLVTDDYPVFAASLRELREQHRRGEHRLLRDLRPDLPEGFIQVVERALDRDPERRFSTAGEMEQALSQALGVGHAPSLHPQPAGGRRAPWIAAAAAMGIVGLVAAALIVGSQRRHTSSSVEGDAVSTVERRPPEPGEEASREPSGDVPADPSVESRAGGTASRPRPDSGSTGPSVPSSLSPAMLEPYVVEAAVIRMDRQGRRERLAQGAKLAVGDWLSLEFEASRDVFLYVINEDEHGHAYSLFPLPDFDLQNPLPGGRSHEVPGRLDGRSISWEVDTAGGREHLLVLASPERLVEFETQMASLARPRTGETAVAIPDEIALNLRGIGGLGAQPEPVAPEGSIRHLFETAQWLGPGSEVARGAWLRRIELENPEEGDR